MKKDFFFPFFLCITHSYSVALVVPSLHYKIPFLFTIASPSVCAIVWAFPQRKSRSFVFCHFFSCCMRAFQWYILLHLHTIARCLLKYIAISKFQTGKVPRFPLPTRTQRTGGFQWNSRALDYIPVLVNWTEIYIYIIIRVWEYIAIGTELYLREREIARSVVVSFRMDGVCNSFNWKFNILYNIETLYLINALGLFGYKGKRFVSLREYHIRYSLRFLLLLFDFLFFIFIFIFF